ncbi:protein FRA10AC1 [Leptopilina heterotoma]|uniref:protein FRA10AC1 n=1 Tax=Leptopilina heterotoma TaxID=63436 RepID=UPI001CA94B3E|nr:protein FRA10AC1 [Leptopilina heterotoma]
MNEEITKFDSSLNKNHNFNFHHNEKVTLDANKDLPVLDRHKNLINFYYRFRGGYKKDIQEDTSRDKNDFDVIRENHKFLWDEDDDQEDEPESWEARLAKKYYDKLFKEYCISDLTHYKYNKIALRWRTEKEVIEGKGQFQCGNKKCGNKYQLRSWEVNFGYMEHGEKKNALVKLRLCPECSVQLNYRSKKREIKRKKSLKRLHHCSISQDHSGPSRQIETDVKETDNAESSSSEESLLTKETLTTNENQNESDIWKNIPTEEEKTREDEFEEYLADLLL